MTAATALPALRSGMAPYAALSASYFAHVGFFNPYLPLWLQSMGLSLVAISLLGSVQGATRVFAPYAWGWLSDHTGERVRLMRFASVVALVSACLLFLPLGTAGIAVVLLVMFTHTSAMMPMSEAAMAHLVSRGGEFDSRRYGRVRLWGSLGFLFTVFAAGVWFERFGMGHFPGWTVATMGAVVLCAWLLPDSREAPHPDHEPRPAIWPIVRQPEVAWFFASMFFHILAHIGVYVFFSLYLNQLGYGKAMIGVQWGISVIVEIVWFLTQGRWLPLLSASAWLVLCAALMVLRSGLTAWAAGLWMITLAQMLHAFTFAAHHATCIGLISRHFPGRLRGRGQALFTTVGYGLSGVLGAWAGGLLSEYLGLRSVYVAGMGVSALALVCALMMRRAQRG
ncbi:MAG TPA: MFS transporter [Burkholderiaceae bacterium]|nr:MFS transporter [Burkholderiaceae bacterium]